MLQDGYAAARLRRRLGRVCASEGEPVVRSRQITPQDGNSLLSSMAAVSYGINGVNYAEKMGFVDDLLFNLI